MQSFSSVKLPMRLLELRGASSQSAFAKNIGINQQTYSRWELGDRQPKLQDLASLALHFGVSTDWLLGLSSMRDGSRIVSECEWQNRALKAEEKLSRLRIAFGKTTKAFKASIDAMDDLQEMMQ